MWRIRDKDQGDDDQLDKDEPLTSSPTGELCRVGLWDLSHNVLTLDYSKIKIAAAITVVHKPRLSPTADCVTLAVRTILFEIR